MERDVEITGDMIRLGQLLKLAGAAGGGAEVMVNGQPELRRGRQLHPGDIVRVGLDALRIVGR